MEALEPRVTPCPPNANYRAYSEQKVEQQQCRHGEKSKTCFAYGYKPQMQHPDSPAFL